ncbi:CI repressor [Alkalidesulfovibrio alkalitolerans DSM 16529]|jgi:DNA-binding Xre family transcriptional regulator|uniref:CI repressor n=1 Tax=Alkalidesulfovibrio alkalitolerans DSM 16529 TaxID=1121439 RepID=S7TG89_9BACT|nr:helix-turn-helix domain-containing protein [Alkalidesulfovibrio alkalitolerans]EPR36227.1 CI repressor [Alkalidesulfovibrio alkalitolerans DSM 16529]
MNQAGSALRDAEEFNDIYLRVLEAAGAQTQQDLAERLGIRQSSVSDAKKKKRVPASWILSLCLEAGYNPRWLLSGEPPRRLTAPDAGDALDSSEGLTIVAVNAPTPSRGANGAWTAPETDRICIPSSYRRPGLLVFTATDDSLSPVIRRGAYVGVETRRRNIAEGDVHAVLLPEVGLVFRRVFVDIGRGALRLQGEGKGVFDLHLPLDRKDERLVGRVAWTMQEI